MREYTPLTERMKDHSARIDQDSNAFRVSHTDKPHNTRMNEVNYAHYSQRSVDVTQSLPLNSGVSNRLTPKMKTQDGPYSLNNIIVVRSGYVQV